VGKGAAGNAELACASPCRPSPCQGWAGPGKRCSWTHSCRKPASAGGQMGPLINRNTSKACINPHTFNTFPPPPPLPIPFLARCSCSGSGFRAMRRLWFIYEKFVPHIGPICLPPDAGLRQQWVQLHLFPGPAQPWHAGGRHGLARASSAFPAAPLPTIFALF